jgi:hypothetical protein
MLDGNQAHVLKVNTIFYHTCPYSHYFDKGLNINNMYLYSGGYILRVTMNVLFDDAGWKPGTCSEGKYYLLSYKIVC